MKIEINDERMPVEMLDILPKGGMSLKVLALMKAQGFSDLEVSKVLGLTARQVKDLVETDSVSEYLEKMQAHFLANAPLLRFQRYVNRAIEVVLDVMETGSKDSDRLKAAGLILDRALGTAVQRVEVKEEGVVTQLLDRLKGVKVIEGVEYIEMTPDDEPPMLEGLDLIEDVGQDLGKEGSSL